MSYDDCLPRRTDRWISAFALALGVLGIPRAHGATPPEALYRQECGECHLAYAPRLLPATTWRQIMTGLDRHFGVDASLDGPTATAISDWLEQASSRGLSAHGDGDDDDDDDERPRDRAPAARREPAPEARTAAAPLDASLRITTTPWFIGEHREVPAGTWTRPSIGSASNCAACHADADQGRFSESALQIPK